MLQTVHLVPLDVLEMKIIKSSFLLGILDDPQQDERSKFQI